MERYKGIGVMEGDVLYVTTSSIYEDIEKGMMEFTVTGVTEDSFTARIEGSDSEWAEKLFNRSNWRHLCITMNIYQAYKTKEDCLEVLSREKEKRCIRNDLLRLINNATLEELKEYRKICSKGN